MMSSPYDLVAEDWSTARSGCSPPKWLNRFLESQQTLSEPDSSGATEGSQSGQVLDLGCGSGVPIARYLLDRKIKVTGVDASELMLARFQHNCREAVSIHADMRDAHFDGPFSGIVAWDSIFHLPRDEHVSLFRQIHGWLMPGGTLLLSLGGSQGEFTAKMFGVDFFYSGYEPERSLILLSEVGFDIIDWEIDDPSSRGHMAILARRAAN